MKSFVLVFLIFLMSMAMMTTIIGCQSPSPSPSPSPAPVTQEQPNTPPQTSPPASTPQPPALPPPPPQTPPSPTIPSLQVSVVLDDGQRAVPIGLILNIKYSINRDANLTLSSTLPDGSVVNYFTKQTTIPGSYVYPIRIDRPIGERIITLTALGIDGQIAKATHQYWAGSVPNNIEIP